MSDKITWWPREIARGSMTVKTVLLLRYDWPDQRLYEIGMFDPSERINPWKKLSGDQLPFPDYFISIENIVEFIHIPAEKEYTYRVKR